MRAFIIAEAGVNHNGSIKTAKKLVDAAVASGADAVKFQTFKAQSLATRYAKKANYQKKLTGQKESQFQMLKRLELSEEMHLKLINYCKIKKIKFLSSPFDLESIELLKNLGLNIFKIPSGEITNINYLKFLGKIKKKIILSTGMSNIQEIKKALKVLTDSGTRKKNIIVLHSNTQYPTPIKDVNLRAMLTIGKKFNVCYGYSDHTLGIEVSIAAAALGASCIEKHITLNRRMKGPDHKASLEPDEFKDMVKSIRNIEIALGSSQKKPTNSELKNIKLVRKSLCASKDIKKGEVFTNYNLTSKRPGDGISPSMINKFLGKKSRKNFKKDQQIS
jgi:N,N'-diacetyllegionaminate synthase